MTMLSLAELSVIFISYDEPRSDDNWRDLLRKCPWAKRVHGVTGFDEAHKTAARLSTTQHFITVDGDTIVEPWLFGSTIPHLGNDMLIAWRSRNAINGLVYGNGSVKCWPRRLAMEMRTHERSSEGHSAVDFGFGPTRRRYFVDEIAAVTYPNATPFQAFRAGFREGVRGCLVDGEPVDQLQRDLDPGQLRYLTAWCSIGADATNGPWALLGARLGCVFAKIEASDPRLINDFDWFLNYWDEHIAPRFRGVGTRCILTGYMWNHSVLEAAVTAAGEQLRQDLDLRVVDLTAEQSRLIKRAFVPGQAETKSRYDLQGNLHQSVGAGPAGAEEAAHCYRMGAALGSTNAMNNLARMNLTRDSIDWGDTLELLLNATALGNRFAPNTLGTLLGDGDQLRAAPKQARHYFDLAAERGCAAVAVSAAEKGTKERGSPAAVVERPALEEIVLAIKDMQVVFLDRESDGGESRWRETSRCCPYATLQPPSATTLPNHDAPESSHVIVVRDDSIIDPRFFDFVIDRGRLADDCVIAWPARDAITGLLTYESGPQCWPRRLLEQRLREADSAARVPRRLASECLTVQASDDCPRQAFESGFEAAWRIRRALGGGGEGPRLLAESRQRLAAELGLWCSVGADCEHGLWSIYGARLGCISEVDAERQDAKHAWRKTERLEVARDLQAAIVKLGDALRQTTEIDVMDLSPAASGLLKDNSFQPFSRECFEQNAAMAMSHGDAAGHTRAAQLYRVAAGLGSSRALTALGKLYLQGLGVAKDQQRGTYLLNVAAAGSSTTLTALAG